MTLLKKALFSRLMNQQTGDSGDTGGGNAIAPEVQAQIDSAVNAAVTGLKSKNGELIATQKQLKESLSHFDGIDATAMKAMMKNFSDSEEAGLLAAGKLDEVVGKRVGLMKADYDKQLKTASDALTQAQAKAAKLAAGKVSGALTQAASKTGALPNALEVIALIAEKQGWTINDDGDVVALRDGDVVLGKDGKTPLSPQEYIESLRDNSQYDYLWPKAQGSGAPGATGGLRNVPDLSKLPATERLTAARAVVKR